MPIAKLTIIVKKNASYEKGEYGYSVHEEGAAGMTANVVATDKAGLKRALKEFGCTDGYADDIVERLKEKNDSVKVMLNKKVGSTEDKEV